MLLLTYIHKIPLILIHFYIRMVTVVTNIYLSCSLYITDVP